MHGRGLFGKKLWITEFGIPTKKLGAHNIPLKDYTHFIRERREPPLPAGLESRAWEDIWDAFFDQVDAEYLRRHAVEAILFYTLREAGVPGFDKDDDDRSNFALSKRDGTPRMAETTFRKFGDFMSAMTGRRPVPDQWSHGAPAVLRRAPWLLVTPPADVLHIMTMLSAAERALLYWLARDYYSGAGKIIDGGCFLGGSTLALGRGLLDGGHGGKEPLIYVYDLFVTESYMAEMYFAAAGLPYREGDSYRPLFDRNTLAVASLLQVNQGDIQQIRWTGEPIEILSINVSKHWSINDVLLTDFFSCLIPGRSAVVQQDFVFQWCPWVAVTMEYFAEYFDYFAFVEHCSTVYLYKKPIPAELLQVKLGELPLDRKVALMERAISRHSGSARGVLECAKAALLLEGGRPAEAVRHLAAVRERYAGDQHVLAAVASLEAVAGQAVS